MLSSLRVRNNGALLVHTQSPIDDLIGGGLPTGVISHIYGEAATGKTTLAMQAAGNLSREGYQTLYIDGDNKFSFKRFSQIFPDDDSLERITLIVPKSLDEQTEIISVLDAYVSSRTRLIVVDTIASQYRRGLSPDTQFSRYREVVEKQLPEMLGLCRRRRNIAMLILNQVISNMEGIEGENIPSMGMGLNKFSQVTLRFSTTVVKSVLKAEIINHYLDIRGEIFYQITSRGLSPVSPHLLKAFKDVGSRAS